MNTGTSTAPGAGSARTAIVGMAGRFPGAADIDALWSMLSSGTEAVRRFSDAELRAAGVPESQSDDPDYVPFGADLPGIEEFDAEFFGITPAEARLMDPQHRIFLESVWAGLEDAGTPPTAHGGRIGVFGSASLSSYLLHNVLRSAEHRDQAFTYPVLLGNDKDFLATRVSYALNLRGPSVTVQSACSSSLVAVDQACAALQSGRCDVAVAGGVSVFTPQTVGYRHQAGGTFSRDGHCRPFDAAASGMVRGSGCGVVVLKRLDDALADRDHIHAVVAGSAVNNDGSAKAGYSAPGAMGQDEVVRACLEASGVPASAVGFVEAHGTGTYLGDPIEVAALQLAYESTGDPPAECALGSIKANIGHLDAAAGVTGLIKTALVLRHQELPPQVNFTEPNPELRLPETPFVVHSRLTRPERSIEAAAVTSLGIGGTNAHCVLERAPDRPARAALRQGPGDDGHVLLLSAPDADRLRDTAGDLLAHLDRNPGTRLDDLAYTLAHGRLPLQRRTTVTARDLEQARAGLRTVSESSFGGTAAQGEPGAHGDADPDAVRPGDGGEGRKIRLPGLRLRRTRHWIEPEPADRRPESRGEERERTGAEEAAGPLEAATGIFRAHLGIASAGPDDDYFALGGDSLHAIGLVDALRGQLGADLTLEEFTRLCTPRRVAEWYAAPHDEDGDAGDTMVLIKEGRPDRSGRDFPVFLIHPSGGSVSFAQALAAHSGDASPVYGIGYPSALAGTLTTVPRMARHYVRLIRRVQEHGPYRVGGYSLGGAVALEAARLLTEAGEEVEKVLMWDTPPPHPGDRALSEQEFLDLYPRLLRLMFGLPAPQPGPPPRTAEEAIESVRPSGWSEATVRELRTMYEVWRVCDRALAAYRPPPYSSPVHLFTAEQPIPDGLLSATAETPATACTIEDWRHLLTGELRATTVAGHHFSMFDAPRLPKLAYAYDQALGAGRTARTPAPGGGEHRPSALLFPGQGSQFEGMGRELFARYPELTAEADEVLGYSIADLCAGDPRRPLKDTAYTQPALYTVGALALRQHREENTDRPAVVLGHSLGEYNALEAAGVFTFAEGLRLAAERGAAMSRVTGGGMIAVGGLAEQEIRAVLDERDPGRVDLAAANAPRLHTLAGPDEELDDLTPVLLERGARSVRRLDVGGPFHSRLMRPAAREFRTVLERTASRWAPPSVPVIANTTARPHSADGIAEELVAQIDHPVLWGRSVERAIEDHDPEFHEIGGRRVLTPMITQVRNALRNA